MSARKPKLVVVTGAGSGIGRATALRFAERGAVVIASDINLDTAEETAKLVADQGGIAHPYRLDVADEGQWDRFGQDIRADHGISDVIVNNAGFTTIGPFLDHGEADWERLMGVNVYGVIFGSRVFGGQMVERGTGGQIINVSSGAGYIPFPINSAYCTTKAAILMFSQCLRIELAPHRIGVTAICPGVVNSGFINATQPLGIDQAQADRMIQTADGVAQRFATSPESVARAIVGAAATNPAVRPVKASATIGYLLSRVSPGAVRLAARYALLDRAMALADRLAPQRAEQ